VTATTGLPKLDEAQVRCIGDIVEMASDLYAATAGNTPVWDKRDHMRNFLSQVVRERVSLMHLES
jgi:hypothetical protein